MVDEIVLTDSVNECSYMAGASAGTLLKSGAAIGACAVIFQFFRLNTTLAIVFVFEAVFAVRLGTLLAAATGVNSEASVTNQTSCG